MDEIEIVTISINYKGIDYLLNVDLQTANVLLNDQDAAEAYLKKIYPNLDLKIAREKNKPSTKENKPIASHNAEFYTVEEEEDQVESVDSHGQEVEDSMQEKKKVWYSKGKPSQFDEEATNLFLQLRLKYAKLFNDKKTVKAKLWSQIANEMDKAGYNLCATKEGPATKCKQKFSNLEAKYLKYVLHLKSTGVERRDPPPFFEELHGILGDKAKSNPENLQDTESVPETDKNDHSEDHSEGLNFTNTPLSSDTPSTSQGRQNISNRFSKAKSSIKPKSSSAVMMEELRKMHEVDTAERRDQFQAIQSLLTEQNKQRDVMVKILSSFFKKKRKREESSDSD